MLYVLNCWRNLRFNIKRIYVNQLILLPLKSSENHRFSGHFSGSSLFGLNLLNTRSEIRKWSVRDLSFSTYAKFSEKVTFTFPWYVHVRVRIGGKEMLLSRKICVRTNWMIPNEETTRRWTGGAPMSPASMIV